MTEAQFFKALKDAAKGKFFMDWPLIRFLFQGQEYCPITLVCKETTGQNFATFSWRLAAKEIGLKKTVAQKIVGASDRHNRCCLKTFKKLQRAAKLA